MKVLIACEESQRVCTAFREKGHEAYSCDIQECSGGHPEWHIQDDCLKILGGGVSFQTMDGKRWLAGCPDSFKSVLTPIKVETALPTAQAEAEGITYDVTYDKVFLPSLTEHYITPQLAEGEELEYWKEINGTATKWAQYGTYEALKKYSLSNHSSASVRWMRSAFRGAGYLAWRIYSSGNVSYSHAATNSNASAPACAIC